MSRSASPLSYSTPGKARSGSLTTSVSCSRVIRPSWCAGAPPTRRLSSGWRRAASWKSVRSATSTATPGWRAASRSASTRARSSSSGRSSSASAWSTASTSPRADRCSRRASRTEVASGRRPSARRVTTSTSRSFRRGSTPAMSREDLPEPDGPVRVTQPSGVPCGHSRPVTASTSSSRPKKCALCSSVYGRSPGKGEEGARSSARVGSSSRIVRVGMQKLCPRCAGEIEATMPTTAPRSASHTAAPLKPGWIGSLWPSSGDICRRPVLVRARRRAVCQPPPVSSLGSPKTMAGWSQTSRGATMTTGRASGSGRASDRTATSPVPFARTGAQSRTTASTDSPSRRTRVTRTSPSGRSCRRSGRPSASSTTWAQVSTRVGAMTAPRPPMCPSAPMTWTVAAARTSSATGPDVVDSVISRFPRHR